MLLVAALFGTLGTSASETAPFLPIEQAILPQIVVPVKRTPLFVRYNLVASFAGALGALGAGLPDALPHLGLPLTSGIRLMFAIYVLAALVAALIALRLSGAVEASHRLPHSSLSIDAPSLWKRLLPPLPRSRSIVLHLSALSFLAAAPLARRIGLLNTMVFTHLPSNALLALVAFMPTFPLAAIVLLLRQALSQMDVPTRQAYTVALVAPGERTAAASVTSLARSAGSATSPVVAGVLKSVYNLTLWRLFRNVPMEAEDVDGEALAGDPGRSRITGGAQ